jgi:hypothetical protein
VLAVLGAAAVMTALAACDLPFGLGQASTRSLEDGAVAGLDAAKSFRVTGSYTDQSMILGAPASSARTQPVAARVTIDLELVKPSTEHVVVNASGTKVEAIVIGNDAFFRGNQFLSQHMGSDPLSRNLVKVAGNSWWKGPAGDVPRLADLTVGSTFRSTFLGTSVTQRADHVSVDGLDTVDLSGPRADVNIAASPPYRLIRVRLKHGVTVDGVTDADFRFADYDREFGIAAPTDVIDFSNLSTLPPLYTVVSVDTLGCGSPCSVSVLLRNLGGLSAAQAPSTVTFTMTDPATGHTLGSCKAVVQPDVGYNSTTTAACTIGNVTGKLVNSAVVTAVADNPGRA